MRWPGEVYMDNERQLWVKDNTKVTDCLWASQNRPIYGIIKPNPLLRKTIGLNKALIRIQIEFINLAPEYNPIKIPLQVCAIIDRGDC